MRSALPLVLGLALGVPASGQETLMTLTGDADQDFFGEAVACAGDVNDDGVDDLIAGAPQSFFLNHTGPGYARVISGADGSTLHTFVGDTLGDRFGSAVATAGDLNGDGHADLIVGADQYRDLPNIFDPKPGYGRVYSGSDGSVLFSFAGTADGDRCGEAVAAAGDVDNDGNLDFVVGAPGVDEGSLIAGLNAGSVRVHSGVDGSEIWSVMGEGSGDAFGLGDQLGVAVRGAGDLDEDGYDDIVAGTYSPLILISESQGGGFFRVYSGQTATVLLEVHGDDVSDALGYRVDVAGDLDQDGEVDFIAGAPFDSNNGFVSGSVRAISGASGSVLYTRPGDFVAHMFGSSVAGLSDYDGDGLDDVACGTVAVEEGNPGLAQVFSGASGTLVAAFDYGGGCFGCPLSVTGMSDLDADGLSEVIVGLGCVDAGRGEVRSVTPGPPAPIPGYSFQPGDSLFGEVSEPDHDEVTRFFGVKGMKLVLTFQGDAELTPLVTVHSIEDGALGAELKKWKVKGAGPHKLKYKLKQSGDYGLRVRGKKGTTGSFTIATSAALPKSAKAKVTKKAADVDGFAEVKFVALPGSSLDVTVTVIDGFSSPSVAVIDPLGNEVPSELYSTEIGDGVILLEGVPLLQNGKYRIRVGGGPGLLEFVTTPTPPATGLSIEIADA